MGGRFGNPQGLCRNPGLTNQNSVCPRCKGVRGRRSYQKEKEPQVKQAALREAMTLGQKLQPAPILLSPLFTLPPFCWGPQLENRG